MTIPQNIQPTFERGKLVWTDNTKEYVRIQAANGQTALAIGQTLGVTRSAILGGISRYSLGKLKRRNVIPDDFAQLWPTMLIQELAAHYGVGRDAPGRWAAKLGLPSKAMLNPPKPKRKPRQGGFYTGPMPAPEQFRYEDSPVGEAHRYCGKFAPTFKVPGGWRYGSRLLSDAELVEKAAFLREREARRAA